MTDTSFTDEFQPVPREFAESLPDQNTRRWFQEARARLSRARSGTPGTVLKMPAQADSTATDLAGLVADFNALLAKLRAAGLMET